MKRVLAVLILAAFVVACGGDDEKSNNTNTNNVNNVNNGNNVNNVDNNNKEYSDNYQLRFDSLVFDNDSPGKLVNGILAMNFDQTLEFPVVVLVDVQSIDPGAGTLELRGGSGLKTETEGEYVWEDGQSEEYSAGTLEQATGAFAGVLPELNFVATLQTETSTSKVVIPIQQLEFSGNLQLSDDGSTASIPAGELRGYLTKEDGDATMISIIPGGEPVSITNVFGENDLNYDTATQSLVEPGEGDAWQVFGTFSAVPTTIQ